MGKRRYEGTDSDCGSVSAIRGSSFHIYSCKLLKLLSDLRDSHIAKVAKFFVGFKKSINYLTLTLLRIVFLLGHLFF